MNHTQKKNHPDNRSRKKRRKWRAFINKKWILLVLSTVILLIISGCSAVMLTASFYDLEEMQRIKFASSLYDQDKERVARLGDTNREHVSLNEIETELLIETYLAVEDRRFYEHNGVDYRAIARAVVANISALRSAEGAGTITMQVARNTILHDRDKTIIRKLRETAIAWNLERKYSKDEILESYLNYIYLGNNVRGIKMATKIYFDKEITTDTLEPHEVALLAGLPQAPELYNPYKNPELAKKRRNIVLGVMHNQGLITLEEKNKYQKMGLGVNKKYLNKHLKDNRFQAYKDLVLEEAQLRYGIEAEELVNGGYNIYTGLNRKAQLSMEKAFHDDALFKSQKQLDGGATLLNSKTGLIHAVGGGREYLHGYTNFALEKRQPGSTIKPITVFAPAVEDHRYNEFTTVRDLPYKVGNWTPKNYDQNYYGHIPMQRMVSKSLNVSSVWLLNEVVGTDSAFKYATEAGLPLKKEDQDLAPLALGGLTEGVNTVQMAQAYGSFANNGVLSEAHTIRKIVTADGQVLKPKKPLVQKKTLFSKKTAYYITRMLKNAVEEGTGGNARVYGYDIAGKTGTTQNGRDAWFVGYTPDYVMAVMVTNHKEGKVSLGGNEYPSRIFHRVMSETLRGTTPHLFKNPGVPEPKPPFILKAVDNLRATYDSKSGAVLLTWNDYSDRVLYRVERSTPNGRWIPIYTTRNGSYKDTSIRFPQSTLFDNLFGTSKQTYYYRVIAIDSKTNKEAGPTRTVKITFAPATRPPATEPEPEEPGQDPSTPPPDSQEDPNPQEDEEEESLP